MKSALRLVLYTASVSAALVGSVGFAQATTWNIVDVLSGGGGFAASTFHTSGSTNPTTGTQFENFTTWSVSGTWDDVSGALTADFSNGGAKSFTIASVDGFLFDGSGVLEDAADPVVANRNGFASFQLQSVTGMDSQIINNEIMTFLDGFQCCGSSAGNSPNSFNATTGQMVLWGATNYDGTSNGTIANYWDDGNANRPSGLADRFGIDMRLQLTPVPIPAALPLFAGALSLMGFLGWRRRRTNATA